MEKLAIICLPYPKVVQKNSNKIYSLNVATSDPKGWLKRVAKSNFDAEVIPMLDSISELSLSKIHLSAKFFFKTRIRRDGDNQIYFFKFLNDILVKELKIIPDDSIDILTFDVKFGGYGIEDKVEVTFYGE